MLGGGRKGTGSAAVLKYDQTGEPLQQEPDDSGEGKTTTGERRDEEVACSVLTPEQIFSQLSMVLQTRCPLPAGEEQRDSSKEVEAERDDADGGCSVPPDSSCGVPRKLSSKTKRGRDAKTRKAAAGQQQTKRTKTAAEKRVEKRPPRRRQRHCQPRRRPSAAPLSAGKNPPETVAESESSSTTVPSFASPLTSCGVHVVVISPQTLSPSLLPTTTGGNVAASNPSSPLSPATPFVSKANPPSADENTSVAMKTPGNALGQDGPHDKGAAESSNNDYSQIYSNPRPPRSEVFAKNRAKQQSTSREKTMSSDDDSLCFSHPFTTNKPPNEGVSVDTPVVGQNNCSDNLRRAPLDYELLGRLIGEDTLTSFYKSFHAHPLSEDLEVRLLDPLGEEGSNFHHHDVGSPTAPKNLPRWLQITRKRMHIDPNLGPISLARILVSNTGIIKFQHLFPVIRTVFMHHVKGCNISALLGELSPRKVLCPGLPDYRSHHSTLGYHPKELRVIHTQTPDYRRFDHRECPIFHIPESNLRWKRHFSDNMCTKCIQLHSFILRLLGKMPLPAVPPHKKCSRYATGISVVENGGLSSSASEVESPPHGSSFPDPHSVPGMGVWESDPVASTWMLCGGSCSSVCSAHRQSLSPSRNWFWPITQANVVGILYYYSGPLKFHYKRPGA